MGMNLVVRLQKGTQTSEGDWRSGKLQDGGRDGSSRERGSYTVWKVGSYGGHDHH